MIGAREPHIVVVGSINLDLVTRLARLPRPGETVHGRDLTRSPGGKGANQAVAAARLGARCSMIGRVGDDPFGPMLLGVLSGAGVDTTGVQVTPDCSSGVALIGVEDSGQNAITIVGGANARLAPEDVERFADTIATADALLVQLEVPMATVLTALAIAKRAGVRTVFDPAPAPAPGESLPTASLDVDVLSPNQSEAEAITGLAVPDFAAAEIAARRLLELGPRAVAIKMGEHGALWLDRQGPARRSPTRRVEVVDTTAAGDAFTAALAVALARGDDAAQATRFACAAGTLATTRAGAQTAMPTLDEVQRSLRSMPS